LISDLINGKENKWEDIYKPSRFTFSEASSFIKHMSAEALSYLKQMPNFNNTDEIATIKAGEGRIVKMLEEEFGVYRDQDGMLHIVSAKCTHMKCSIAWNADELSWDCPCHGSRFTYEGEVINGPANFNLPSYRFHEEEENVSLK
jgi:Rieske Fe-S protein